MIETVLSYLGTALTSIQKNPWADEILALWVPIAAYWIYSMLFHCLMMAEIPYFERYRIHSADESDKRNKVTIKRVLAMVTLQQLIQVILGALVLHPVNPQVMATQQEQTLTRLVSYASKLLTNLTTNEGLRIQLAVSIARAFYWVVVPTIQFCAAMVIMDTHQYFLHRLFHLNKFLYKHIHSHHHRLYVPYAFGALYNHPVEGFLLDSLGATLAFELTRMTPRMMDDHCGYFIPWNPLQFLFGNNVKYHDIHHQAYGIKTNFSQPFFTFWDKLLGTEMPASVRDKKGRSDKDK